MSLDLLLYQKELNQKYEDSLLVGLTKLVGLKFSIKLSADYSASFLLSSNYMRDVDDDNKFVDISFLNKWLIGFNHKKGIFYSIIDLVWLLGYLLDYEDPEVQQGKILYLNKAEKVAFRVHKMVDLVFLNQLGELLVLENGIWKEQDVELGDVNLGSDIIINKILEFSLDKNRDLLKNREIDNILYLIDKVYVYNKKEFIFSLNVDKLLDVVPNLAPI